ICFSRHIVVAFCYRGSSCRMDLWGFCLARAFHAEDVEEVKRADWRWEFFCKRMGALEFVHFICGNIWFRDQSGRSTHYTFRTRAFAARDLQCGNGWSERGKLCSLCACHGLPASRGSVVRYEKG